MVLILSVTFSGVTVNTTKDTTGNYKVTGTTNGTLTINPASCTLTANSGTKTYNGSSQSVTGFTSSPSGLSFSGVSASGSRKDVGSSDVTFSGVTINTTKDTTGNYKVTGTTKGTLTITKAAASALGLSVTNYSGTYDGSPHKLTATVTVSSGTTIQYSTDNTNWSNTNPQYTNVGTYTVYVRAVNNNYNTATATGTIAITAYLFAAGSGIDNTLVSSYTITGGTDAVLITNDYIELNCHTKSGSTYYSFGTLHLNTSMFLSNDQRVRAHYIPLERKCPTRFEVYAEGHTEYVSNPSQEGILSVTIPSSGGWTAGITFKDPSSTPTDTQTWFNTASKIRIDNIWIEDI